MPIDLYDAYDNIRFYAPVISEKNLITGEGHGHHRDFYRERPEKNAVKKAKKRTKMAKSSRRKNRK